MEPNTEGCKGGLPRPRLCVLTTTYPRDEADPCPPFVFELCSRLSRDFAVTVIAPDAPGARHGPWEGVEVIRYRYAPARWQTLANGGGILPNLRRSPWMAVWLPGLVLGQALALWTRRRRFDLIHAHWIVPQGLIAVCFGGGRPVISTSHGADVFALRGRWWDSLRRFVLRRSAAVSVVGQSLHDTLAPLLPGHKLVLLPMGIDLTRFEPPRGKPVSGRLLFVGRLVPKKGLDLLLRALPLLAARGLVLELHVVGDGPERHRLEAMARPLALPIHFVGAVHTRELPQLYATAELVVLPFCTATDGDAEGLGLTLIEALASGCKVVSGNTPAQESLPQAEGWWRCDARDTTALVTTLQLALQTGADPVGLRAQREAMLRPFGWEHLARAHADLLLAACRQEQA